MTRQSHDYCETLGNSGFDYPADDDKARNGVRVKGQSKSLVERSHGSGGGPLPAVSSPWDAENRLSSMAAFRHIAVVHSTQTRRAAFG